LGLGAVVGDPARAEAPSDRLPPVANWLMPTSVVPDRAGDADPEVAEA